jgi:hypothetical protein
MLLSHPLCTLAPTLSIQEFFHLLERFGGYNELKQVGVVSVLLGQMAVGTLGGILYGLIVEPQRANTPDRGQQTGRATNSWLFVFVVLSVAVLWLITLVVLWPVLGTPLPGRHGYIVPFHLRIHVSHVCHRKDRLMANPDKPMTLEELARLPHLPDGEPPTELRVSRTFLSAAHGGGSRDAANLTAPPAIIASCNSPTSSSGGRQTSEKAVASFYPR